MKKLLVVLLFMFTILSVSNAAPFSTRRVTSSGWDMLEDVNAVFSTRRVTSSGWDMLEDVNAKKVKFEPTRVTSGGW